MSPESPNLLMRKPEKKLLKLLKLLLKRPQLTKFHLPDHFKTSGALWLVGRFSLAVV
jgi:hypothetical protein